MLSENKKSFIVMEESASDTLIPCSTLEELVPWNSSNF